MPNIIKCSQCSKPATVHLTQIVNNKIIKVDLCESCAQAKGVTDPSGFSLTDFLGNQQLAADGKEKKITCKECGFTAADFRRTGRLGCALCYHSFSPLIRPVLEDMHVASVHKGKVPEIVLSRQMAVAELQSLKDSLQEAIDEEEYEEAAKYRDQIQSFNDASESKNFTP